MATVTPNERSDRRALRPPPRDSTKPARMLAFSIESRVIDVNPAAVGDRNRKPPNQSRWRGSGSSSSDDFYGEGPGDERGALQVGTPGGKLFGKKFASRRVAIAVPETLRPVTDLRTLARRARVRGVMPTRSVQRGRASVECRLSLNSPPNEVRWVHLRLLADDPA